MRRRPDPEPASGGPTETSGEAARSTLGRVVDVLVQHYAARRIILVQAVATAEGLGVELLVEGLPPTLFSEASALASRTLGGSIRLIALETAPPEVVARALTSGEALHG